MSDINRKDAVGIALSGGGLQGIAHIGAYRALTEMGIKPQYVSGTSSGSLMAALIAMGFSADEMAKLASKYWRQLAEIDNGIIFRSLAQLILNKRVTRDGIKSGELISNVVKAVMDEKGIKGFEDLPINLSICTVDTYTTDECIFLTKEENISNPYIHYITGAPIETAVRASMSFPAIYTTCPYKNYNFMDGGAKDNLPVKVLKDLGVGKTLAIGFNILNYDPDNGLDGLIKVIWRALDVYSIDSTRKSMEMADFAIEIDNKNTQLFSIDNLDETIEEGYEAVMQKRDDIMRIFG